MWNCDTKIWLYVCNLWLVVWSLNSIFFSIKVSVKKITYFMLVFWMIKTESQMKQKCELLKKSWKLISKYVQSVSHKNSRIAIFYCCIILSKLQTCPMFSYDTQWTKKNIHWNLDITNKSVRPFLFTISNNSLCISNVICLANPQKWELGLVHYIVKFTTSRFIISRFECIYII